MNKFESEFKERLKKVSEELNYLESLLRNNGIDIPNQNIVLEDEYKIKIPVGYIREVKYFEKKYRLYELISNETIVKNIAYALQASDFFNYILNRYKIGLSVGKVFFKHAIINIFSVIEALLYGIIDKCHSHCQINDGVCKKNANCEYYFKKPGNYNFKKLLFALSEKKIINISDDEQQKLIELKRLRDNIHIWDTKCKDYFNDGYNLNNYNYLVKLLGMLKEVLSDSLKVFEDNRKYKCKKY